MGVVRGSVEVETSTVGFLETPVVTVSGVPTDANVGDKITPSVNVKREDGATPISGAKVDFFFEDADGPMLLGDRQTTDVSGDATAAKDAYVSSADADGTLKFVIVIRASIVV